MSRRAVVNTAFASYVQMASIAMAGLMSVSLALKFLDTEHMGLWSFVVQSLGYFLLLDFGVTNSIGRLMGEPLHSGDVKECGRWLSLFLVVTGFQGLLIFLVGYFSTDWVIAWFNIAEPLRPEAHSLWLWMLSLNALTFPLRIAGGILFAQNRSYWPLLASAAANWVGLLAFFLFLKAGTGTLAYAYSAVLTTLVSGVLPWLAVKWGPHRFKISFSDIRWSDLKMLFNFSSGVFVIGVAIQVIFLSQSLIITKLLGLSAVTLFMVSSKAGTYGLQILWRTFDSLCPRWQQFYVAGDRAHLAASFQRYTGLTMSLALLGGTFLVVLNHPFVNLLNLWAHRPGIYAGAGFDALLALYIWQHAWNHCLSCAPILAKDIRVLSWVAVVDMLLNIVMSVALAQTMGVKGVLAGSIIGSLVSMAYLTWRAPRYLSLTAGDLILPSLRRWLALGVCMVLAVFIFRFFNSGGQNLWLRGIFCALTLGLFFVLHRDDLQEFWVRARRFKTAQAAA
ncbi:MAG: MATE family efflux transporter [Verrucomicrobiia bacterium]